MSKVLVHLTKHYAVFENYLQVENKEVYDIYKAYEIKISQYVEPIMRTDSIGLAKQYLKLLEGE